MERQNKIKGIDIQPEFGKEFFLEMLYTILAILIELGLTFLVKIFTGLGINHLWLIFGGLAAITLCVFAGLEYDLAKAREKLISEQEKKLVSGKSAFEEGAKLSGVAVGTVAVNLVNLFKKPFEFFQSAFAAAALNVSMVGSTKVPDLF